VHLERCASHICSQPQDVKRREALKDECLGCVIVDLGNEDLRIVSSSEKLQDLVEASAEELTGKSLLQVLLHLQI